MMSVIYINMFYICDIFLCFFGFRNINDIEKVRVKSYINVIVIKYVVIIVM